MQGKYMVTFHVESLFTNIPLEESIDLAVVYILQGIPNIKFTHDDLKKLFFIATPQTYFLFDGSFYDPINSAFYGVAAATCLGWFFLWGTMKWSDHTLSRWKSYSIDGTCMTLFVCSIRGLMPRYFLISSTPVVPTYDSQWKRNQIINCLF